MTFLATFYALFKRLWAWLRVNPWVVTVCAITLLGLTLMFCGREERKPDIQIVSPQAEIDAIQRERDERIGNDFNAIDRQRERDDSKIREAQNRPSRNGNVNARDLEEMLK